MEGVLGNLVSDESQGGGQAGSDVLTHLGAQNTLSGFQRLLGVCGVLFGAEHGVVEGCVLQVVGHAGIGNGHKTEAGILNTTLQRLRHNYLDAVGKSCRAGCISHVFLLEISWCFREHSGCYGGVPGNAEAPAPPAPAPQALSFRSLRVREH